MVSSCLDGEVIPCGQMDLLSLKAVYLVLYLALVYLAGVRPLFILHAGVSAGDSSSDSRLETMTGSVLLGAVKVSFAP